MTTDTGDGVGHRQFFFLHVKKAAGITVRGLLKPHYVVSPERVTRPRNFIQSPPAEHNDVLNNYRVVLGEYKFRRSLFAKTILYPDTWAELCSFAFARNPLDRCVSMFHYLYWTGTGPKAWLSDAARNFAHDQKVALTQHRAFDHFLDQVEVEHNEPSILESRGLHFSTHTARMWEDVTDLEGEVLLSYVFRLESLVGGVNLVFAECGIDKRVEAPESNRNRSKRRHAYRPTPDQVQRVEQLYAPDFELYEKALNVE